MAGNILNAKDQKCLETIEAIRFRARIESTMALADRGWSTIGEDQFGNCFDLVEAKRSHNWTILEIYRHMGHNDPRTSEQIVLGMLRTATEYAMMRSQGRIPIAGENQTEEDTDDEGYWAARSIPSTPSTVHYSDDWPTEEEFLSPRQLQFMDTDNEDTPPSLIWYRNPENQQ